MNTYRQATLDLKEIKLDENLEEIKRDFEWLKQNIEIK
jgi:hypothetical protein